MKKTAIILTILLLSSNSAQLFACSCIGQRTVKEELKHSDAVVVGTILNKQLIVLTDIRMLKMFPNDSTLQNSSMSKITIACFDLLVHDIYKGRIKSDTLKIYTGIGGGDCGVMFEIGDKYIIYGQKKPYFRQANYDTLFPKSKNSFWTYICLRTTAYRQDEITEIEKITKKKRPKTEND